MPYEFVQWIGHASFLIKDKGKNIYIDPFNLKTVNDKADVIFITHSHFDHFNMDAIKKIATKDTQFVVPKDVKDKLTNYQKVMVVEPGKEYSVDGIKFKTIRAYNINKEFHKKEMDFVGYILDINGTKIYHAGDTDFIEEMKGINVDLALLPISGHYTMDVEEAIKAAKAIKAKNYAPMHYKQVLGRDNAKIAEEKFKREVKNSILLVEIQEPDYSFER